MSEGKSFFTLIKDKLNTFISLIYKKQLTIREPKLYEPLLNKK